MTQIFVFGDSIAYGVGDPNGGWVDMIKRRLHHNMYGENGVGEKDEVHSFSKPGGFIKNTVAFAPIVLEQMVHDRSKTIIILSKGLNDTKALDTPDNHVSDVDTFRSNYQQLVDSISPYTNNLCVLELGQINEAKTNPKKNPFTGGLSFFRNDRVRLFNQTLRETFAEENVQFILHPLNDMNDFTSYLCEDGIHPNEQGHELIAQTVMNRLKIK